MPNQITINFTPCSVAPALGYRAFFRRKDSSDSYVAAVNINGGTIYFTGSPIVFQDSTLENGSLYEGYIVAMNATDSDCPHVAFVTVQDSGTGGGGGGGTPFDCNKYQVLPLNGSPGFVQWTDCETGSELSAQVTDGSTLCSRTEPFGTNISVQYIGDCTN